MDDTRESESLHRTVDEILKRLVAREGGYTHNPLDAGGCTNYGITVSGWQGVMGSSINCEQLKAMRPVQAIAFYRQWGQQYGIWQLLEIHPGLTEIAMDSSVLFGAARVIKWIQLEVGVDDDGIIGPDTMNGIVSRGARLVATGILRRRIQSHAYRVSREPSQVVFLCGWMNRCTDLMNLPYNSWSA